MRKYVFNLDNLYLLLGVICVAVSVNVFAIPTELGEGGVTGITMLLYYTLKIPTYISNFVINGIIILIGFRLIEKRIVYRSIVTVILISVFLSLTSDINLHLSNSILGAIFAGLFMGIGIGFIYRGESTAASSPLIAKFIEKYFNINKSVSILAMDMIVIIPSIPVIGVENSLLTLISVYVGAKAISFIVEGASPSKTILLLSDKWEEIAKYISTNTNYCVTLLDGAGYYSKNEYKMIYCVVENADISEIINAVKQIDLNAFMTITNTSDVFGGSFESLENINIRTKK